MSHAWQDGHERKVQMLRSFLCRDALLAQITVPSLLLAAAICVGLGQYKMTLDIKTRSGLLKFKICVIIPFFVMLWARGYVWATEVYSALKTFHDAGDDAFFYGALPLSLLMTLFNLVLIVDVTQSFVKYVILGHSLGGWMAPPCGLPCSTTRCASSGKRLQ